MPRRRCGSSFPIGEIATKKKKKKTLAPTQNRIETKLGYKFAIWVPFGDREVEQRRFEGRTRLGASLREIRSRLTDLKVEECW